MLTVRGESMIEAGIMDGDYILVEQQTSIHNENIIVAIVDGFESEATDLLFTISGFLLSMVTGNFTVF